MKKIYKNNQLVFILVLVLVFCSAIPALSVPKVYASTNITIDTTTTLTANGTFKGFGIQEDTNFLWTSSNTNLGAVVPDDFNTYVKPRLQKMKLPWVRKFIDLDWFAPTSGSYTWTSSAMTGLYTDLQVLKEQGTEVLLTIWRAPQWLTGSTNWPNSNGINGGAYPQSTAYDGPYTTAITDMMKHLYGSDGSGYSFTNIKYLNANNELEETSMGRQAPVYSLLDSKMTTAGIRSNVTLIGPDMYNNGSTTGTDAILTAKNDTTLNPLLGFYDWHAYNSASTTITDSNSAKTNAGTKQVWVTEFADFSTGNNNWTNIPTYAINIVNHGQAAASLWDIQDQGYIAGGVLDNGKWGLWGFKTSNYATKTAYYVYSNITAHVLRDSVVYNNTCANESCANLRVAAFKSPTGDHTIFAYNLDTVNAQTINVSYSGASPTQTLYRYLVDPASLPTQANSGDLQGYDKIITMTGGVFSDTIPAGSFAVYSAVNPVAPPVNSNLAANATITGTSSVECCDWFYSKLNDGQRNSVVGSMGWTSNNTYNTNHTESVTLNLGTSKTVSKVDLYPRNDSGEVGQGFPINFTIQTSTDNTNWTTRVTQTGYAQPGNAVQSFTFTGVNAQYVKIEGTNLRPNPNDANRYRMVFAEVELYNGGATPTPTPTPTPTNIAIGASVTSTSSYELIGWGKLMANDGQRNSVSGSYGWTSDNNLTTNHTESITLNMGSGKTVSKVDLYPRNDSGEVGQGFPINFTIQTSTDNTNWTTRVTQTGYAQPGNAVQSFTFTGVNAQYVKIEGTNLRPNPNDANRYRMVFAEVELY